MIYVPTWDVNSPASTDAPNLRPCGWDILFRGNEAAVLSSVPFTFRTKTRTISVSMAGKSITGEFTLAAAIRRYFDVVLYLLIFTGFGTLASTGSLDFPTVLIVSGALLFRGYMLARRLQVTLSERWTNLLTMACFALFVADEFVISRTFLASAVHLVLSVMLVRLFSAQKDRDHYLLAIVSLFVITKVKDLLHKAGGAPPRTKVM